MDDDDREIEPGLCSPPAKRHCQPLDNTATCLAESGYSLVDSPKYIIKYVDTGPAVFVRQSIGRVQTSRIIMMLKVLTVRIWELIVQIVNRNISPEQNDDQERN